MPFFSVVIPLYNKQTYIKRSLNSVLAQTMTDFEVVVIDDGSTDSSAAIVKSILDQRVRLIQQQNSGVSAARNRGISECYGEWVAFLDADDEYFPECLQEMYSCVKKFPQAGAVYVDPVWFRDGEQINVVSQTAETYELLPDYFDQIIFHGGNEINSSCVAVKKAVFSQAGLFPVGITIGEDSDMWMRIAWSTQIAHVSKALSIYHMDAGESDWEKELLNEAYWVKTYNSWLTEGRISENKLKSSARYFQRYILSRALRLALKGKKHEARRMLIENVDWLVAPKRYAFKVLLYSIFPIRELRSWSVKLGRNT